MCVTYYTLYILQAEGPIKEMEEVQERSTISENSLKLRIFFFSFQNCVKLNCVEFLEHITFTIKKNDVLLQELFGTLNDPDKVPRDFCQKSNLRQNIEFCIPC